MDGPVGWLHSFASTWVQAVPGWPLLCGTCLWAGPWRPHVGLENPTPSSMGNVPGGLVFGLWMGLWVGYILLHPLGCRRRLVGHCFVAPVFGQALVVE